MMRFNWKYLTLLSAAVSIIIIPRILCDEYQLSKCFSFAIKVQNTSLQSHLQDLTSRMQCKQQVHYIGLLSMNISEFKTFTLIVY